MRATRWISFLALAASIACLTVAPTGAADQIYWANEGGDSISHADVSGGGGADIPISGVSVDKPFGLAIDSAAGKIYWVNWNGAEYSIRFANLDGTGGGILNTTGAPVSEPHGLAIYPAAGRVYWVNWTGDTVYYANLNGSGGGELDTTGALVEQPLGVAVYPAQSRIYWANFDGGNDDIDYANLDGTGEGGTLDLTGAEVDMPGSLAIDPLSNRVYWGNREWISFASTSGGGGGQLDTDGLPTEPPEGIAIDAFRKTLYWADYDSDVIGFAGLEGGALGLLDTTGATRDNPVYPVLLQVPRNLEAPGIAAAPIPTGVKKKKLPRGTPVVKRHSRILSCSGGSWAPDVLESFLYRAPQSISIQWVRNGAPIPGEASSSFRATEVGTYLCRVTATNGAGSTSKDSPTIDISARFALGRVIVNARNGTAKILLATSGPGVVALSGKGLKTRRLKSKAGKTFPPTGALVVKAKGRAKARLHAKHRSKVKATVTYTPTGGAPLRRRKSITLRLAD